MAGRGPRPKSAAQAKLEGNYRPDKHAPRELFEDGVELLPEDAPIADAHAFWATVLKRAEVALEAGAGDLVTETPNGHRQKSPWLSIAAEATTQLRHLSGELGRSPGARARLGLDVAKASSPQGAGLVGVPPPAWRPGPEGEAERAAWSEANEAS